MSHRSAPVLAIFCLLWLTACDRGEQAAQAGPPAEGVAVPTIALIMKSLANEFFVTMAAGAEAHHREHDQRYDLVVNGIKDEIDLAQQVALIDQMIASRVDAIVISPADSRAVVPALARARAAGIVIVNIDNRLEAAVLRDYDLQIPFVGPDNFLGAYTVGQYLGSQLSAGDEVAIIEGVPTAYNSKQRSAGFRKAMDDAGMAIVAQQSAQWDQTKAVTVTSGILVRHPNLAGILCANDNSALGAVAAVTQAGKAGRIRIVGYDNISAVRELIRNGVMLATIEQHADRLAVFGIEYALDALASPATLADKQTPAELVTADNVH